MARIRTVKPEFWSDEKLSECPIGARLLFIGLISFADDKGRLECSPVRLRMQIFPCGSVTHGVFNEWLGALTERSLSRRYVVDGKEYLDIPGFEKHQRINRPTDSKLPAYVVSPHGAFSEPSVSVQEDLGGNGSGSGSGRDHGMEGIGNKITHAARAQTGNDQPDAPEFVQIRTAYPRRAGGQRWPDARRAVSARRAEGVSWAELLDGTSRYATFCRATGKEGTEFVQQAATFFGRNRGYAEAWTDPLTKTDVRLSGNLEAAAEFMRRTEPAT